MGQQQRQGRLVDDLFFSGKSSFWTTDGVSTPCISTSRRRGPGRRSNPQGAELGRVGQRGGRPALTSLGNILNGARVDPFPSFDPPPRFNDHHPARRCRPGCRFLLRQQFRIYHEPYLIWDWETWAMVLATCTVYRVEVDGITPGCHPGRKVKSTRYIVDFSLLPDYQGKG